MGVNAGSRFLHRVREACSNGLSRPLARNGKGAVLFASTDEVLSLVYRPNLTVRDVCIEAALVVEISPVALDFFTLVTEDGKHYLNPERVLFEDDCSRRYQFRLCIKACFGSELRDFDKKAFEYYFHQCRQDFLKGTVGKCTSNSMKEFAELLILEILFQAKQPNGPKPHVVIDNPRRYGIRKLLNRGELGAYTQEAIKLFLKEKITPFEKLTEEQIKPRFISILEGAEDFFVHKLYFEKAYNNETVRKFEILVSAEFGIKKRWIDMQSSYPEDIVKVFSEVEELEVDPHSNRISIFRENRRPEVLMSNSPEEIHSLMFLIEGYYRLIVNQYKELTKSKRGPQVVRCHGPIERRKAEFLLHQESVDDGFCLLRRKREDHYLYALSVCVTSDTKHTVMHFEIEWNKKLDEFNLKSNPGKKFSGLTELVEHYRKSKDGLPVCLTSLCLPKTEGFDALLDQQLLVPKTPDVHLVDPSFQIPLEDLDVLKTNLSVGKGEFGFVRKGTWICPSADEPVDIVSRALLKLAGGENIRVLRETIREMSEIQHTHLIHFYGVADTEKALIFVFDFGAEGPLDQYIKEQSGKDHAITKGRIASFAAQIAEGMMYLHSKNCVHGRLSAHNVFVANEESVKISDSRLHLVAQKRLRFYKYKRGYGSSYCWFAPLSLQHHTFDFASDIWAFGMTLWEMFAMKKPFHCSMTESVLTEEQVMGRYLQGRYLDPCRPNCPSTVASLIKRCWSPVPEERPPFCELVAELRSPELVPEDEACQVLLPPDISSLEDWEKEMLPQREEMQLQPLPVGSQPSDVDYACLPGNPLVNGYSEPPLQIPGSSTNADIPVIEMSGARHRTLSKTFSHPGPVYDTAGTSSPSDPRNLLGLQKPSISRVNSCPPAIQSVDEVERHEELRYVSMKSTSKSAVAKQLKHSSPKLFPPDLIFDASAQLSSDEDFECSVQHQNNDNDWQDGSHGDGNSDDGDNSDGDDGESGDDDGDDSDDDDDDGDDDSGGFDINAELMAMRSLGNFRMGGHVQQEFSDQAFESLTPVEENQSGAIESNSEFKPIDSFDFSGNLWGHVLETGSQAYVNLSSTNLPSRSVEEIMMPAQSTEIISTGAQSEQQSQEMETAGSYVKLPLADQDKTSVVQPKDLNISEQPCPVSNPTKQQWPSFSLAGTRSTDDQALELSVQHSWGDCREGGTGYSFSTLPEHNAAHQPLEERHSPGSEGYVRLENNQTAHSRSVLEEKEAVDRKDVVMLESPDKFLASLFSHHQQQSRNVGHAGFFCETRDGFSEEPKEESLPLIKDLCEETDVDSEEEPSCRDEAEMSLGNVFASARNRSGWSCTQSSSQWGTPMESLPDSGYKTNHTIKQEPPVPKGDHPYTESPTNRGNNMDSSELFDVSTSCINKDQHCKCDEYASCEHNQEALPPLESQVIDLDLPQTMFPSSVSADNSFVTTVDPTTILSGEEVIDGESNLPSGSLEHTMFPGSASADNSSVTTVDPTTIPFSEEIDDVGSSVAFWSLEDTMSMFPQQSLEEDRPQEQHEMETLSLNNLSKESSDEHLDFCDDHYSSEGSYSSHTNQFDDASLEGDSSPHGTEHADVCPLQNQPGNADDPYKYLSIKTSDDAVHSAGHERPYQQNPSQGEQGHSQSLLVRSSSLDSMSSSEDMPGVWPTLQSPSDLPEGPAAIDAVQWPSPRKTSSFASSSSLERGTKSGFDKSKIPLHLQVHCEYIRWHERLGEGQFGEVKRAEIVSTSTDRGKPQRENVAVKMLKKKASDTDSENFKKEVENMIHITSKQSCDYIITLRGVCIDKEDNLMLITELAPHGALISYLPKNKGILGIPRLLDYSMQICRGMKYLDDQSLLHRDLATRNILVMQEDLVKITDFGLSRLQDYYKTYKQGLFPIKWYALESITRGRFTSKSDVWSFGVTMWEIFTFGDTPYKGMDSKELTPFLEKGDRLACPPICPEGIYDIMHKCWHKDPMKRPSFFLLTGEIGKMQKQLYPPY